MLLLFAALEPRLERPSSTTNLSEARREVSDELHQVLHGLDDLRHGEVVEHLLALADDLAHLRLVEAEQQGRSALQDAASTFDQFLSVGEKRTRKKG